MIILPDFNKAFEYENNFLLSCGPDRLSKIIAHYTLFERIIDLEGDIIECGVFKGASFCEFSIFIKLFCPLKKLIGFDTFQKYPEANFDEDKEYRNNFINEAGSDSISKKQLIGVLKNKGITKNIELIKGNICKTIPKYIEKKPNLKVSLLNLDVDLYEPARVILENLWDKMVKNSIVILDDYNVFPGETKAVKEFFKDKDIKIEKFNFRNTPNFIVKNN